ncbi:MAG TPA: hypothetical protein VGH36_06270 [Acetobacteraceae bacterium]|jgi:hypothetical protein
MQPIMAGDAIPFIRDVLQIASSIAVIMVAIAALIGMRLGAGGKRVQLDIDLQVLDVGNAGEMVGELVVTPQNMGFRPQKLYHLFLEVRPSRHVVGAGAAVVPVTNLIGAEDHPIMLAPAVRRVLTWTFEVQREERLLRATALINISRWLAPDIVTSLSQKHFWQFGPDAPLHLAGV